MILLEQILEDKVAFLRENRRHSLHSHILILRILHKPSLSPIITFPALALKHIGWIHCLFDKVMDFAFSHLCIQVSQLCCSVPYSES